MQATPAYKVFSQTASGDKAQKLRAAVVSCRSILEAAPEDTGAMHALGLIECHLGHLDEGVSWLGKALDVSPSRADIAYHYGLALLEQKKWDEAVRFIRASLDLQPANAEAHYHIGVAHNEAGRALEAEEAYLRALAIDANYAEALNNLGNLYNNRDAYSEALACYHRAIRLKPGYAMPYNNMGLTLVNLGKLDEAERYYRQALKLQPHYPEALNNLGIVFRMRGDFAESRRLTQMALDLRAEYPEALNNLGNAHKDLGDMDAAIDCYRHCISLKDTADYRHNLALALLAAGHYEEGWKEYEWRWSTKQLAQAKRHADLPLWQGEAAAGRTLLISGEQGFGDSLQFCRYAPMAQKLGFRVVLEVPAALKRLMQSLPGVDQVVARGEAHDAAHLHCPVMSLPAAFGTTLDSIPFLIPYLSAEAKDVEIWRNRLANKKNMRVGLVWAGSGRMYSQDLIATDRRRSLSPEAMIPLLDIEGVDFFSLQKTGARMPDTHPIDDYMNLCRDFADTAALVANLDLVISVDTAMAHLAGAMGKPVWLLNRFDSCWRWLQKRDDSPWYPTLRQFRQTKPGEWADVIERVRGALSYLATTAQ